MSLYDKASLVFSSKAAAGKDGKAYNIKPVEKLKVDELITNGGFDDDSSWTKVNSPTFSNGQVRFQASDGTNRKIYQTGVFEGDKTYKVSFDVVEIKEGEIRIGTGANSVEITSVVNGGPISTPGSHSLIFKNRGRTDDDWIYIQPHTPSDPYDFTIDNVSVKEVEQKAVDFTMVRGSNLTATREAPSGLIEKGRENLIEYSNDFSKWTYNPNVHNAPVSGQTGYDGSTDAWLIDKVASDNSYLVLPTPFNYTGVFTWSMYAKNESGANNGLHMYTPAGQAKFDLTGSGSVVSPSYANISATIESIGSGWFRCSFAADGTFTTTNQPRFKVVDTAGDNSTGKIYVQDTQLEQGLAATPYIHTTDSYSKKTAGVLENEPRYDYSGGDAVLLLEPERQNKFIHSEYLASSSIFKTNSSFTANQGTSPEGLNNAAKMNEGTASGNLPHNFYYSGIQNSKTYTISFYAKKIDRDHVYVNIYSGVDSKFVFYDLSDGTVATTSLGDVTASISDAGSGWYRISYTRDTASTGSPNFRIGMSSANGTVDYQGNGSETLFYGVQWEEGSYATSYIPTYGSAATRDDDVLLTLQDIPKVNLDKYTFFAHNESERKTSHNRGPRMSGTGNSSLMGYFGNVDLKKQFFLYDNDGGTVFSEHTFDSFTAGDDVKYAFVIDNIAMTAELFINGVSRKTASLTTRVDASKISSGNSEGDADNIKSIMYFPEALSDADAVSLTTI